jgi:hypothetical protein
VKFTHFMSSICILYVCSIVSFEQGKPGNPNTNITITTEDDAQNGFCVVTSRNSSSPRSEDSPTATTPRSQSLNLADVSLPTPRTPVHAATSAQPPVLQAAFKQQSLHSTNTTSIEPSYAVIKSSVTFTSSEVPQTLAGTPFPSPIGKVSLATLESFSHNKHQELQHPDEQSKSIPAAASVSTLASAAAALSSVTTPMPQQQDQGSSVGLGTQKVVADSPHTSNCLSCLRCCLPACGLKKTKRR